MQLSRIHNITDITGFLPKRKPLKVIMRDEVNEFKRMLKIMINERFYFLKKDICISLDIATESINKVPYIGIILYFIQRDNNTPLAKTSLLISFTAFETSHTTLNISNYTNNILVSYNINVNPPIITNSAANIIKLQEHFPLLVCFAHKLHTCIARSFTDTINEEMSLNHPFNRYRYNKIR